MPPPRPRRTPYMRPRHPATTRPRPRPHWWRSGAVLGLVGTLLGAVLAAAVGVAALNEARAVSYREQRLAAWMEYIRTVDKAVEQRAPNQPDDRGCNSRIVTEKQLSEIERVAEDALVPIELLGTGQTTLDLNSGIYAAVRDQLTVLRNGAVAWNAIEEQRRAMCAQDSGGAAPTPSTSRDVTVADYRIAVSRAESDLIREIRKSLEPAPWWKLW